MKKEKIMKHELVHETVNIKGWDVVGPIDWKIGDETELPELMQASGETVSSTAGELSKKVRVNPDLERKLWTTKVQRDIDDCQKKYPSSCAMQLGFLADKWDVDARHLKTNYRVFGGLMT